MKNFKDLLSEVAQPKSPEEKAFKDQHTIELIKHPVAPDYVHTGEIQGVKKKERPADVKAGEDAKKYDGGAAAKAKPFKMPRNIDENKSKLTFKGLIDKVSDNDELLESPQEEISMMMKQLHFICYASEEIMEYLGAEDLDPEEWWQNKLAQTFGNIKSLYAYAKGSEVVKKDIEQDDDLGDDDDDIPMPDDSEVDNIMNSMYEGVEETKTITEAFALSESKIDVDYIGNDTQKQSHEQKFNVKISMHGDDMAFVSGEAKDVWKFAVAHYDGDEDDAADIHPNLAKEVGYEMSEEVNEANFKAGNLRLKNGQTVKLDFHDVKSLNAMLKGLNPKNKKEMEDQLYKDKKGFEEILKFAIKAGV
jgi:hypothetical protein